VKLFCKKYMLYAVLISLVSLPTAFLVTDANAQDNATVSNRKNNIKKVNYQNGNARKEKLRERQLALAEQRAKDLGNYYDGRSLPHLASDKVLVVNQNTGEIKYAKNSHVVSPIASITKLMTAMVVLDARQPFDEVIDISEQDVDTIKGTKSRLAVGTRLSRADMFRLALMSSENRAAFALARHYPGGKQAFVRAMNVKALSLGLTDSNFVEPTGLMYQNTSTAEDLYKLVAASYQYPEIRHATTTPSYHLAIDGHTNPVEFKNTNSLVREGQWDIGLSKTGFINEAGRCLVMQATMDGEPVIMILLNADGTDKRTGDANRVRKWIEYNHANTVAANGNVNAMKPLYASPNLVMSGEIYQN
jgi:serine-type D-Ala-D-Ala endopeptidase (penicillin-binding protein 7)